MPQKTYWHLAAQQRMPSEYEIVTSRLAYHPGRGFEIDLPLGDWYARYQSGSPLRARDWERFRDPRETTYASYTALQTTREAQVDGLLESMEPEHYRQRMTPGWHATLTELMGVLRYPCHGLQMASAYVGQMAPCGRIIVAAAFQTGDEMRRVQRLAYRLGLLRLHDPEAGEDARTRWQAAPHWQALRSVLEGLLVTWDWGEAMVALNLCLKPLVDEFVLVHLGALAREAGDYLLEEMFASLHQDCQWHRAWTRSLLTVALEDEPDNRGVLQTWVDRWLPPSRAAIAPLVAHYGQGTAGRTWAEQVRRGLEAMETDTLAALGLSRPEGTG